MEKLMVNEKGAKTSDCLGMTQEQFDGVIEKVKKINDDTTTTTESLQKVFDAFPDEKERYVAVWICGQIIGSNKALTKLSRNPMVLLSMMAGMGEGDKDGKDIG
jgi:hypothetical protein